MGMGMSTSATTVSITGAVTTTNNVSTYATSQTHIIYTNLNASASISNAYTVPTGKRFTLLGMTGLVPGGDYQIQVGGATRAFCYCSSNIAHNGTLAIFTAGEQIDISQSTAGAHIGFYGVLENA